MLMVKDGMLSSKTRKKNAIFHYFYLTLYCAIRKKNNKVIQFGKKENSQFRDNMTDYTENAKKKIKK